jgi:hypothetical protein
MLDQPNGTFQLNLQGEPNYAYALERSTDLVVWTRIATNIAFSGTAHFVDTSAALAGGGGAYRAVAH